MCATISIKYEESTIQKLVNFLKTKHDLGIDLIKFNQTEITFNFFDKIPFLPVISSGKLQIFNWGNRDASLDAPKTGWARYESLSSGKWNYLKPKVGLIPAIRGCEKGVWFNLSMPIRAALVEVQNRKLAYMITEKASASYLDLTSHNRMPRLYPSSLSL